MKLKITYHIWLGQFSTKEEFYQYIQVDYSDDGPINRFIQDQGQLFYDEDFGESEFFDASFKDFHKFITLFSYGDQIVDEPQTVVNEDYEVHYMGTFIVSPEVYEHVK